MKWDLTPELLFTFVVWPVFRELLWLALGWRLTLAAAVGLTQLLQFELSVFLLSSLLPWMTFHHGNFPFSSGLCWFLGRGCSLSHRSMHTELCGTVCLHVRVLSPCSSWKHLGQELWAPVLCWGCCRQVQAPVQLGRTDVLLLQPSVFWQTDVAGAWWALDSCSSFLSVLIPCFGVSLPCFLRSLQCRVCWPCRTDWYLCQTEVLSLGSA